MFSSSSSKANRHAFARSGAVEFFCEHLNGCSTQEAALLATVFAARIACAAPLADLPPLPARRQKTVARVRAQKILV